MSHQIELTSILLLIASASGAASSVTTAADLDLFQGEWIYVEDLTEGRPLEQLGPPMSSKFSVGIEKDAVILLNGHGSGHQNVRIAIDGTVTEVAEPQKTSRYSGVWQNGELTYEVNFHRTSGNGSDSLIRRRFRVTPKGLIVRSVYNPPEGTESVGLYRHAEDIDLATPAKAAIGDLAWLSGSWAGTRGRSGTTSVEERWSPARGGAMLGVSRTVSRDRMSGFEYLRIIERDEGLAYIAQPGGRPPTEYVLSELSETRAVFDNPRHDYPKRIVYELSTDGSLRATIGFIKGGSPRRFEFRREGDSF